VRRGTGDAGQSKKDKRCAEVEEEWLEAQAAVEGGTQN